MQYYTACVVLAIFSLEIYAMPQKFCGDNLTQIMSQYCLSYNTPAHRIKRQIVQDCCRNTCSLQYLLSNYCEKYNNEALERYLEKTNDIKKEKTLQNENIQETSAESYSHRMDVLPQVRENYSSRYSRTDHVEHVHKFQWNSPSQHPHASHDRKRRKTKNCHNRNKNSKKRNTLEFSDVVIKTAPEPKLGQIEDSQKPFYVFRHNNR